MANRRRSGRSFYWEAIRGNFIMYALLGCALIIAVITIPQQTVNSFAQEVAKQNASMTLEEQQRFVAEWDATYRLVNRITVEEPDDFVQNARIAAGIFIVPAIIGDTGQVVPAQPGQPNQLNQPPAQQQPGTGQLQPGAPAPVVVPIDPNAPISVTIPAPPNVPASTFLMDRVMDKMKQKYTGVNINYDGYYSNQCVDLPWQMMGDLGVTTHTYMANTPVPTWQYWLGGSSTIVARSGETEIEGKPYHYEAVTIQNYDDLQRGDVVIIGGGGITHVALFDGKSSDGSVMSVFEQNRDGGAGDGSGIGSSPSVAGWSRDYFVGAIRLVFTPR